MAIYSLQCKIIGRGKQGGTVSLCSVVAAAAYRAGACLYGKQDNCNYDFTRKKGVVHSEILLAQGAPGRYHNRTTLWNEVEAAERRHDAQYCRELVIAMPIELSHEDNIKLARQYIQQHFVGQGMCADISLHDPHGNNSNPHVHVMLTMRELQHGHWGKKERRWNETKALENWREQWAVTCNDFLAERSIDVRIDHRTLKAQGIDRAPTVHLGVKATALERKGVYTEKGNINRSVGAYNTALECGVETPTILSGISELWQRAVQQRRGKDVAAAPMPMADVRQEVGQERDTRGGSVQRRTYTSLRDVVRQGSDPAPYKEKKDALLGDNKGAKQPLPERQRQQQTNPTGEVLRQPAWERKPTLGERFAGWLLGEKAAPPNRGAAIYDIKVMSSMLTDLSKHGIDSYAQLEQKLEDCTSRAQEGEQRLVAIKDKLHQVYYARKVAQNYHEAIAAADKLRGQLVQAEAILGAAFRCQTNRHYAEEYRTKVLFLRDNYYKKFGDKIEAYNRAAELLRKAGVSEQLEPAQLQQPVERIQRELRTTQQKVNSAAATLKAAGIDVAVTDTYFEPLIAQLKAEESIHWREVQNLNRQLEKWQRIAVQLDNVLEGKRAKEPMPPEDKDKNKNTPSR